MTQKSQRVSKLEQALDALSLATWNRPRSTNELQAFLNRREAVVETVEAD
ncbi:MAG: hypothetical protein H6797_00705 [Candidatus Nomurabacteria bacterium]|nr:MAG: hypothetical protein H6797_00705 [Candidatus Nomurabacteria bacterium]